MLRSLLVMPCLSLLVALALGLPAPARAESVAQVRADADWILEAQLPDGAIANYVDRRAVWPYLANYAAEGLAEATQATGDPRYADAAWRWLQWYQAHERAHGFVADYRILGRSEISTGREDSTDAYAGTFLVAAQATWQATHDPRQLRGVKRGIEGAVRAIAATQEPDGLTWALPSWHVKYLMDESETYGGLRAAVVLAGALGDRRLEARAARRAARLYAGIQRLWNPRLGAYDWALHGDGWRHPTDWSVLYPDAMEQVWAVAFGLASGSRARQIMNRFLAAQPDWARPAALARFDTGPSPVGYWAVATWALARVGNDARARRAADRIRSSALTSDRAWPFTPANAGQLIALSASIDTSPCSRSSLPICP